MRNRTPHIRILTDKSKRRYYKPLKYPPIPLDIDDIYIITTVGDRLDLLANQFYGDVRLWWLIASANMDIVRRDSFALKTGLEIRIPVNVEDILTDFEEINNKQNNED